MPRIPNTPSGLTGDQVKRFLEMLKIANDTQITALFSAVKMELKNRKQYHVFFDSLMR